MITDSIGQDLHIGDEVAYVHRTGSSVSIDRRTITEMGYRETPSYRVDREEAYLKLEGKNARPVMPYNVVRLEKVSLGEHVALQQRLLKEMEKVHLAKPFVMQHTGQPKADEWLDNNTDVSNGNDMISEGGCL